MISRSLAICDWIGISHVIVIEDVATIRMAAFRLLPADLEGVRSIHAPIQTSIHSLGYIIGYSIP